MTWAAATVPISYQPLACSQLVNPSSMRSMAQSSWSRVVIRGGMNRITFPSGPQRTIINSLSRQCALTWSNAFESGTLVVSVFDELHANHEAQTTHVPNRLVTFGEFPEPVVGSFRQVAGVW